jgi:type I restriction enzyme S subunit
MTFNLTKKKVGDCIDVTDFVANGSFASLKANVQYLDNASPDKFAVLVRTLDFNRNWNGEYVWVDKEAYHFLKKSSLIQGDLVLCNVGSVGIVFEVPDLGLPMTLGPNSVLCRTKDRNIIRQRFIYYYFLSSVGQALLEELSGGSTVQPKFNKTVLRNSEIDIPDLAHQDFIVHTLGILDSKISTNAAISKTLENIAQTIFKSWFIDFDPVKAKMAGEKPAGMDAATAALFPESMEESELGLIPQGWSISKLGEYLNVTKGKSYKSSELEPSKIALVTLKSFKRGGGYRFDGLKPYSGDYKPEQIVESGDLIVSFTDVTQAADVIGKPAIVVSNPKFSTLVASLDVGIVRTTGSNLGKNYLYQLFSTAMFKNHIDGYTNGTTVLHLGKNALEDFTVPLPDARLMSIFESLGSSVIDKLQAIYLENLSLEQIRDSLLPRLISGELQIPDEMLAS